MNIIGISRSDNLIVRAGRIFDGQSLLPGQGYLLTIKEGIIREILPLSRESNLDSPDTDKVLDFDAYTILPGLVDCHVHLALDGKNFRKSLDTWEQEDILANRIQTDLNSTLNAGIMAVRDGGDQKNIGLKTKNLVSQGVMMGPVIRAVGQALRKKGLYGSFLGSGLMEGSIQGAIEKMIGLGADQIKVLVSGLVSLTNYRQVGELQFTPKELREIVFSAHQMGVGVMAHASSDPAIQMAIEARVDSLEHGYFISEKSLKALARAEIPWVPTLTPVANQVLHQESSRYSCVDQEVIERTYRRQQEWVKKAAEMGIRIGIGTDSGATGVPHGKSFLQELILLEEAGLSREEILRAATQEGSAILGLGREMGRIAPGFKPYLIAVKGNPSENLHHLAKIESMIFPSGG